jgi:hypothetical protein
VTAAEANALVWDAATSVVGFLGFGAVLLLGLALIGLAGRW